MRDLYLEKIQAFTTNSSFGKSITTGTEKESMRRNELLNIWGGVKHLKLENISLRKSVRFPSKIKRKNQERLTVL